MLNASAVDIFMQKKESRERERKTNWNKIVIKIKWRRDECRAYKQITYLIGKHLIEEINK